MLDLLRLTRFPNLVVVVLTQLLVHYRIIRPALDSAGIMGVLTPWKFVELALVTLCITLSGYLVNDLVDGRTDAVNRPGDNPVERIGRVTVSWLYCITILGGYLLSLLLAFRLGERRLLWIFPLAVGLLTLYSTALKRLPAVGNLLVALYCAGVPGVLVLAERAGLRQLLAVDPALATNALRVCALFMVFAFTATLLRELVKDLEDMHGDAVVGRRTLPVVLGPVTSQRLAYLLGLMVIGAILAPVMLRWPGFLEWPMVLCIGILLLLLLSILYRLSRARRPPEYRSVSQLLKLFLLGGLGLLAFF